MSDNGDYGGGGDFFSALQAPSGGSFPFGGYNGTLIDPSSRIPQPYFNAYSGAGDGGPQLEIWGDSIAHKLIDKIQPAGGYAVPGATPSDIDGFIRSQPPSYWQGKTIALSSGSNPYNDQVQVDSSPGEMDQVGKTIQYLKDNGANVIPIGYGVKFPNRNAALQKIADANGLTIAPSVGTVPAEGVHPSPAGYTAMGKNIAQLHANGPQDYGGGSDTPAETDPSKLPPVQYGPGGTLPAQSTNIPTSPDVRGPLWNPPTAAGSGSSSAPGAIPAQQLNPNARPAPPPIPGPAGFTLPGGPLAPNTWTNPQTGETSDVADALAQRTSRSGGLGLLNMLSPADKDHVLTRGLLAMSAAFADAAKPSLMPTGGMGAAFGRAMGAFGAGVDQATNTLLQQGKLGLELQQLAGRNALLQGAPADLARLQAAAAGRTAGGGGGPSAGGGGGGGGGTGGATAGNAVYNYARSIGASPNEATLLTSAAGAESSYRPDAVHDGGIGYGLFGHNGSRLAAMQNQYGANPSWQNQVQFALNELRSRPESAAVNAAQTPEQLTEAQMQFEQPNRKINNGNWNQRLASTQAYMTGSGGSGGGPNLPAGAGDGGGQPGGTPVIAPGAGGVMAAGAAGGGQSDALAQMLAYYGSKYGAYGLGDIIKPYTEMYYKSPGYLGAAAGAQAGAQEAAKWPYTEQGKALDEVLAEKRAAYQAEIDRANTRMQQQGAAGLELVDVPVRMADGSIGTQKMTRLEAAQRAAPASPEATAAMAPAAPQPGVPAPAGPAMPPQGPMPGTNLVPGPAARPFASMRPAAPAAAAAAPAPTAGGFPVMPQGTPAQDYRWAPNPDGSYRQEVIPGTPTAQALAERDSAQIKNNDSALQAIDEALGMSSLMTTGWVGGKLANQDGTEAHDLRGKVEQIRAATQVAEMQRIRAGNPIGGGAGMRLSPEILNTLQTAAGHLDQTDSKGAFDRDLLNLRSQYLTTMYGTPQQIDQQVAAGQISPQVGAARKLLWARGAPQPPGANAPSTTAPTGPAQLGQPKYGEVRLGRGGKSYWWNGGPNDDVNNKNLWVEVK